MASSSLLTEAEEVLLLLDLTLPDLGEIFKPPRPAISAATIQHGESTAHARIYGLLGAGGREHEHWRSGQVEMRWRRRAAAGEGEWVTR